MTNTARTGATDLLIHRPAGDGDPIQAVGDYPTMTARVHNHADADPARRVNALASETGPAHPTLPRWLLPGSAVGLVVAGLVLAGVVSLSTVLFLGFFGGMILMHTGGHSAHGGHAGHAASASEVGHDDLASNGSSGRQTDERGQHGSHGCH